MVLWQRVGATLRSRLRISGRAIQHNVVAVTCWSIPGRSVGDYPLMVAAGAAAFIAFGAELHKQRFSSGTANPAARCGAIPADCSDHEYPDAFETVDIGSVSDFPAGKMQVVKIHNGKNQVLVSNVDGKLFCTGNSCTHYSAGLNSGVLTRRGSVRCPWHDAEFDLLTGNPVAGPALDRLPTFPIRISDNQHVLVDVPKDPDSFQEKAMVFRQCRDEKNKTVIGIVGAGPGSLTAAETLRQEGFTGKIIMFGDEPFVAYDRPILSKNFKAKIEKLQLRDEAFIRESLDVEFHPSTPVAAVDAKRRIITTASGKSFACDKIIVATGSSARRLEAPGSELANIVTLRSFTDVEMLQKASNPDSAVVIIGSSFLGMEVAGAFVRDGAKVTVVGKEPVPLVKLFGPRIGEQLRNHLMRKHAMFRSGREVKRFVGTNGKVSGVVLDNGDVLQADLVVLAVGASPNTAVLKEVQLENDKSVKVDPFMQVPERPGVYAVGDIARFPYYILGDYIRVEHWINAMDQARVAAKHITGKFEPYSSIPFVWTMIAGKGVRYAGYCSDPDDIVIEGDVENLCFCAYFVKDEKVQAIATCGKDPTAVAGAELLKRGLMPPALEFTMGLANAAHVVQTCKAAAGYEIIAENAT